MKIHILILDPSTHTFSHFLNIQFYITIFAWINCQYSNCQYNENQIKWIVISFTSLYSFLLLLELLCLCSCACFLQNFSYKSSIFIAAASGFIWSIHSAASAGLLQFERLLSRPASQLSSSKFHHIRLAPLSVYNPCFQDLVACVSLIASVS